MHDIKDMHLNQRRIDDWNKLMVQLDEHERVFQDETSQAIRKFIAHFTVTAQKRMKAGEHLFDFANNLLMETKRIAPLSKNLARSSLRAIELCWVHGEAFEKWRKANNK